MHLLLPLSCIVLPKPPQGARDRPHARNRNSNKLEGHRSQIEHGDASAHDCHETHMSPWQHSYTHPPTLHTHSEVGQDQRTNPSARSSPNPDDLRLVLRMRAVLVQGLEPEALSTECGVRPLCSPS